MKARRVFGVALAWGMCSLAVACEGEPEGGRIAPSPGAESEPGADSGDGGASPAGPGSEPGAAPVGPGSSPAGPGAAPTPASWSVRVTGAGIALVYGDQAAAAGAGEPVLRVACVRDPATMQVEVSSFQAIGSEERLSFGVDDEPFVFVADPTADRPSGVLGEGPIEPALLDLLLTGQEIHAVYGAQSVGPLPVPDAETVGRFVDGCRGIAGRAALHRD